MENLKILEWNINQRSTDVKNQEFVGAEILRKNPDVAILVEFKGDENVKLITKYLSSFYYILHYDGIKTDLSEKKTIGNGVLIALSKIKFESPNSDNISSPKTFIEKHPKIKEILDLPSNMRTLLDQFDHQTTDDGKSYFTKISSDYPELKNKIGTYENWTTLLDNYTHAKTFFELYPDWLKIDCTFKDNINNESKRNISIIGLRARYGKQYTEIKNQIDWFLSKQNNSSNQFIIGDFNYGAHVKSNGDNSKSSWYEIINMMRDYGYCRGNDVHLSPYAPIGTSWQNHTLDWLIMKGNISLVQNSAYNQFDWSFSKYYDDIDDIRKTKLAPGNPDHAIFTVEISIGGQK